jgi:hypothetical protein
VARELVTLQLFTWVGVGLLLILIQKLSWWEYHFLLLIVPVGILAIRGLDGLAAALAKRTGSARSRVSALTVLVVLVALGPGLWFGWMKKAKPVVSLVFSRERERVREYQIQVNRYYRRIWWETRFLADADAFPGPIYVFGNPIYLLLSGRDQALPIHGWGWEFFLQSQWEALPSQLAGASPPYLYVSTFYKKVIAERSPAVKAWIEEFYVPIKTNARGTWYRAATRGRSGERGDTG